MVVEKAAYWAELLVAVMVVVSVVLMVVERVASMVELSADELVALSVV